MKNIMIALVLMLVTSICFAQKKQTVRQQKMKSAMAKYHDNIDNRMKGPNGEVIYIGTQGGRYYIKNGKKVYVEYKGNDKK